MATEKGGKPKKTPVGRFSFISIFSKNTRRMEGQSEEDFTPQYEVTVIFDKEYIRKNPAELAKWNELKADADAACMEKFKKNLKDAKAKIANFHDPFRDGAEKEHLDGFGEGTVFIKFKSFRKPGVVGPDLQPIDDADMVYPGCYGRVSYRAAAFEYKKMKKGVKFYLNNVMFVRDGERLDGGSSAEEDFGEEAMATASDIDDI